MKYIIIVVVLCFTSIQFVFAQDKEKPQKHFKLQEIYPDGKQTSYGGTIAEVWTNPSGVNTESYTFENAPINRVWAAAKHVAEEFTEIGKRPVKIDEKRRRISNSNIEDSRNKEATLITTDFVDEVITEVTQIGENKTKVTVSRKVFVAATDAKGQKGWRNVASNGKIERWILTQIEKGINDPNLIMETEEVPTSPVSSEVLNNKKIIDMVRAGLSDKLIISTIQKSNCDFDTSSTGLIQLRSGRLSDALIEFIMEKKCLTRKR
jgi:hypothetical protein